MWRQQQRKYIRSIISSCWLQEYTPTHMFYVNHLCSQYINYSIFKHLACLYSKLAGLHQKKKTCFSSQEQSTGSDLVKLNTTFLKRFSSLELKRTLANQSRCCKQNFTKESSTSKAIMLFRESSITQRRCKFAFSLYLNVTWRMVDFELMSASFLEQVVWKSRSRALK